MPSIDRFRRQFEANFEVRWDKLARCDRPEITEQRNLSRHASALSRIDHATHGRQTRSSFRKRANIFFSRHSSSLTPKNDTPSYRLQLLRVNDVRFYRHLSRTGESFCSTYPYTRVSTVNASKYTALACYIRVRIGQRVDQMARQPMAERRFVRATTTISYSAKDRNNQKNSNSRTRTINEDESTLASSIPSTVVARKSAPRRFQSDYRAFSLFPRPFL